MKHRALAPAPLLAILLALTHTAAAADPTAAATTPAADAAPAAAVPATAAATTPVPAAAPAAASASPSAAAPVAAPAATASPSTAAPDTPPASAPPSGLPLAPAPAYAPLPVDPAPSAPPPDLVAVAPEASAVTPAIELWLGFHDQIVATEGLDLFSENDALPTFHAGASATVHDFGSGQLALSAGADFGGSSASLRGQSSELGVMRLGAGPELRFPLLDRLSVFGRLAPQALHFSTELYNSGSGLRLSDQGWAFALDAALGTSVRLASLRATDMQRPFSFYLRLEAGYVWSPALDLRLTPSSGNAPLRSAPLELGELALRGMSFGAALVAGY